MLLTGPDGHHIHYEWTGSHELPMIVLSHSLGTNLSMWEPQLRALESRFRVLRYDIRGHGSSSLPDPRCTIADLGTDVLRLLDHLAVDQVVFCGLSLGGVIGQWLGINAPQRISKLILANTAAKIGTEESWNARIATVSQNGLAALIPGTLERWFTAGFRSAEPSRVARVESMLQGADATGYMACCAAIGDADFRGTVANISLPTLIIAGRQDVVTTTQDAEFLASRIQGSSLELIDAAHLSSVEASDSFNKLLLKFLNGHEDAS